MGPFMVIVGKFSRWFLPVAYFLRIHFCQPIFHHLWFDHLYWWFSVSIAQKTTTKTDAIVYTRTTWSVFPLGISLSKSGKWRQIRSHPVSKQIDITMIFKWIYNIYPKNHGISKLMVWRSQNPYRDSNPSFLEGPMIPRAYIKLNAFLDQTWHIKH